MCLRSLRQFHAVVAKWAFRSNKMPNIVWNLACERNALASVESNTTPINSIL